MVTVAAIPYEEHPGSCRACSGWPIKIRSPHCPFCGARAPFKSLDSAIRDLCSQERLIEAMLLTLITLGITADESWHYMYSLDVSVQRPASAQIDDDVANLVKRGDTASLELAVALVVDHSGRWGVSEAVECLGFFHSEVCWEQYASGCLPQYVSG